MCKQRRTAAAAHCFVILTLAIGAFIAAPAAAQSITGTILGNVTDADGLALPGATVTATNTETGATRTVVTDSEGSYLIGALQIGLYRVDVTMSGFRSFQQEQFSLSSAQNARVDARLAVGGVTEQVDVVANAIRVDTRSSSVVTNVDRQRMDELPMLNRSVLTMAVLAPGITEVACTRRRHQSTERTKYHQRVDGRAHEPERHSAGRRDAECFHPQPPLESAVARLDSGVSGADQRL